MWWLLLSESTPVKMLEIRLFRGQVISLWAVILQRMLKHHCEIHGISPFSPLGDSSSNYPADFNYKADVIATFRNWNLEKPILVKALSTDPKPVAHVQNSSWDLIYIDGSHEYETVLSDYHLCRVSLRLEGLLVLDDASIGRSFCPPSFSFAGHPGPSQVAQEYADKEMKFLGSVGHNNVYLKD